jgi:hypothetical protein
MPNLLLTSGERVFDRMRDCVGLRLIRRDGLDLHVRPDGYVASVNSAPSPLLNGLALAEFELAA